MPHKNLINSFLFFKNSSNIADGECAWIGASTWSNGRQYRWIDPDQDSGANGELLSNTYNNFTGIACLKKMDVFSIPLPVL